MSSIKRIKSLGVMGLIGAGMICAPGSSAWAQDGVDMTQIVTADQVTKPPETSKYEPTLSLNVGAALTQNKDVVGAIDGVSTLFSLGVSGGLIYSHGKHAWKNSLTVEESWARTPALEEFVKNNDQFQFESLYNYFLLDWFGPFARFALTTAIFDTEIVTADPAVYDIKMLDGTVDTRTVTNLKLADSLEPLTLSQSIGLFADPISSNALTWNIRVGAGARETFAHGVLAINDDADTVVIEATELDDVFQAGVEAFTGASGKFDGGRFTYEVGFTGLLPLLNNDDQDRSAVDLLRWGLKAGVTVAVTEWMGLNYGLQVLKDPQLLDAVQVQNNLLLTFKYTLIEPESANLSPSEQAAAYREEAQEAEKTAAELRAKALEEDKKAQELKEAEDAKLNQQSQDAVKAAQAERDALAAEAAAAKAKADAAEAEAAEAKAEAEEAKKKAEEEAAKKAQADTGATANAEPAADGDATGAQDAPATE